ncbi:DNA mismatch repair protein Msh2 [Pleurostoma richardsiae]|uniref:DNA mismatch repair protein Msh2 n=1 Tax=Pleurostoma richardsiae TaxID=41990 RepID=A0AA38RTI1_9PEZI|nr:DNA mismatch repair protein Msh2 [Pleurostoma richardsiae]
MPGRGRPRSTKVAAAPKPAAAAMSSFTRVSKHGTIGKELLEKTASVQIITTSIEPTTTPRKRKAPAAIDDEGSATSSTPAVTSSSKRQRRGEGNPNLKKASSVLRRRTHRTAEPSSSDAESSDTQQAGALLERLNLHSSSPSTRTSSPLAASTPATSIPDSEDEDLLDAPLPQELLDLINLHAAFLKSLALHYAHNGTGSPVDLRAVCPSIAQSWGKRKVTLEDVRRCIGVVEASSPFFLCDYGRGRVFLELHQQHLGAPLDEKRLGNVFGERLQGLWSTRRTSQFDVEGFIRSLPLASVKKCESAGKIHPMLAKGQRTLQELKNGIEMRKQEKEAKTQAAATATHADGSKMSLLDRIRYKELLQSQKVQEGTTPEELERRAALQRAEDIAAVIGMLSIATAAGQQRLSFTMPVLLQKLKDSLRVPISKEEGAACIRLLAGEIAPQWLRIVKIGGKENVVVQAAYQPTKDTIQERVKALSA